MIAGLLGVLCFTCAFMLVGGILASLAWDGIRWLVRRGRQNVWVAPTRRRD